MLRHVPFAIGAPLGRQPGAVLDYWQSLRRGEASIPFADDVDMARLRDLCDDVFVLAVFAKPLRFRIDLAYTPHSPKVETDLQGRFIDEIDLPTPLDYLRAQADATIEGIAPTCYRHSPTGSQRPYVRLLLPAWAEGEVRQLLGAVEWR